MFDMIQVKQHYAIGGSIEQKKTFLLCWNGMNSGRRPGNESPLAINSSSRLYTGLFRSMFPHDMTKRVWEEQDLISYPSVGSG